MERQSGRAEADRARQVDRLAGAARSPEAVRARLAGRLRARRQEIERVVLDRATSLGESGGVEPLRTPGQRRVVAGAVAYGIEGVERGAEWPALIPPATARHARHAAREGVRLDLVLRRYTAGNRALEEFVVAEAEGIPSPILCQILGDQAPRLDRLLEFVADEYKSEYEQRHRSPSQTKADRIARLVRGDGPAASGDLDLGYDFDGWHLGLILRGPRAELVVRTCAERLGCRLLYAAQDDESVWAWLGDASRLDDGRVEACLARSVPPGLLTAFGEARRELEGWRLSHREAQMALQVMLRSGQRFVRAREVVLHFAVMSDETTLRTLVDSYLGPLKGHRSAATLLEALRAYLASGGNAAAAAAALGVTRHTVHRRIKRVEEMLGRPLHSCLAELQIALQVDALGEVPVS